MYSEVSKQGDCSVFQPVGDMNIYRASELKEKLYLTFMEGKEIVMDLSQVSEIDSSGIQLLIVALLEAGRRKIKISFLNPSAVIVDILMLTRLNKILEEFTITNTEQVS